MKNDKDLNTKKMGKATTKKIFVCRSALKQRMQQTRDELPQVSTFLKGI